MKYLKRGFYEYYRFTFDYADAFKNNYCDTVGADILNYRRYILTVKKLYIDHKYSLEIFLRITRNIFSGDHTTKFALRFPSSRRTLSLCMYINFII